MLTRLILYIKLKRFEELLGLLQGFELDTRNSHEYFIPFAGICQHLTEGGVCKVFVKSASSYPQAYAHPSEGPHP